MHRRRQGPACCCRRPTRHAGRSFEPSWVREDDGIGLTESELLGHALVVPITRATAKAASPTASIGQLSATWLLSLATKPAATTRRTRTGRIPADERRHGLVPTSQVADGGDASRCLPEVAFGLQRPPAGCRCVGSGHDPDQLAEVKSDAQITSASSSKAAARVSPGRASTPSSSWSSRRFEISMHRREYPA
jgi:hypothetical protein